MKSILMMIMLVSLNPMLHAEENLTEFDKALIELNSNNKGSAIRRLQQIAENNPEHYRARWLLIRQTVMSSAPNFETAKYINDEVKTLIELANQNNDPAYVHFIKSSYAYLLHAYDTALAEINLAIALEPDTVLYNWSKANVLVKYGDWMRDNKMIYEAIEQYKVATELAGDNPPPYFTKSDYHFRVGYSYGRLKDGEMCPVSAIDHYLKVTELSESRDRTVAYAWNNVSCAYRKLGQCDKAKEASQNALNIMEFGMAEKNLRNSEFCLKMQRMGYWGNSENFQTK